MKMNTDTTALRDKLYPMVTKALSKNESKYKACIGRFIQSRAASLYDTAPNDRIYFLADDYNDFYTSIGLSEKEIVDNALQYTYYWGIPFKPKAAQDPLTCAMMMVIRYYIKMKKQKELELAVIYLSFSGKFYPSVHYGSFPKVTPGENRSVMDYVINADLNNKFDLKREGNVFGAIRSIGMTWLDTYKARLTSATDEEVAYCIDQLHDRIKAFMVNIATAFYKAYENKDYFNYEADSYDEDNFHLADSDTLRAGRYTEKAMTTMTTKGVNYKYCTMCADQNVKKDEVKFIIESILHDQNNLNEMRELVQLLISTYMAHNADKDIRGTNFLVYSIKSKPNAKDKNLTRIKEIVVNWLNDKSPQYRKRKSREATANSYEKAILSYVVLTISDSNK